MLYDKIKCPDCEEPMVSRKGKFGVFWGYKNFPVCKGTRDSIGRSKEEFRKERDLDDDRWGRDK